MLVLETDSVVKVIGSFITLFTGISIILLPAISGIVVIPLAIIESNFRRNCNFN